MKNKEALRKLMLCPIDVNIIAELNNACATDDKQDAMHEFIGKHNGEIILIPVKHASSQNECYIFADATCEPNVSQILMDNYDYTGLYYNHQQSKHNLQKQIATDVMFRYANPMFNAN